MAVMRSIPNMTVVCPADCSEIIKVVSAAAAFKGPMYIRLTGAANNPVVYEKDYPFEIGRSILMREGDDVVIIANGTMVYESLEAAKILQSHGISAAVVNMHTVKPLDKEAVNQAMQSKLIVTIEEHSVVGGLGAAVAEYKTTLDGAPPQLILGLPDKFGKTADYRYLLEYYGLVAEKIAQSILRKMGK